MLKVTTLFQDVPTQSDIYDQQSKHTIAWKFLHQQFKHHNQGKEEVNRE